MEVVIAVIAIGAGAFILFHLFKFLINSGVLGFVFRYLIIPILVGVVVNVITGNVGVGVGGGVIAEVLLLSSSS